MINGYKIVSYCTYYDPTCQEILLLNMAVMGDTVDEFIICEANKTQSGLPNEFKLRQRIEEFGLPKDKIKVIELNFPEDDDLKIEEIDRINTENSKTGNENNINSLRSRVRERMQKDALLSVLDEYDDKTVFIVRDCDEIVDPVHIPTLVSNAVDNPGYVIHVPMVYLQGRADLRSHYLDGKPSQWDRGVFVCLKQHLKVRTPLEIRCHYNFPWILGFVSVNGARIEDMGWHFSWMGPKEKRIKKRDGFCHSQDALSCNGGESYSSEKMTNLIMTDPVDGSPSYSAADWETLKSYPHEKLPKQLFEDQRLLDYFLPGYKKPDYSVSEKSWQARLHVVDNFYSDPYAVRELALKQQYSENGSRGVRSHDQFIFPGVKESFEKIIGKKITNWSDYYGICGRFQFCTAEDALVYHCDCQRWAAMVFLTPDAPIECGTALLRHKKTGIRTNEDPRISQCFMDLGEPYFLDPTPFEEVDVVGNVFNRLIIFDGRAIHTARRYFGNKKENSRLFQIFFFDVEE